MKNAIFTDGKDLEECLLPIASENTLQHTSAGYHTRRTTPHRPALSWFGAKEIEKTANALD